jgi:hypothetical protein
MLPVAPPLPADEHNPPVGIQVDQIDRTQQVRPMRLFSVLCHLMHALPAKQAAG